MLANRQPSANETPAGPLQTLRILADDLSGAADCAASFTGAVGEVLLVVDASISSKPPSATDLDTRAASASEAAERFSTSAGTGTGAVYKKIDSTLRGHIAVELDALVTALGDVERVVIAPAFPQQGRTLEGGRPFVDGKPFASWHFGLAKELANSLGDRYDIETLTLPQLARPDLRETLARMNKRARILIADSLTDAHLRRLALAMADLPGRTLPVGSSGLARAIADAPPRTVRRSSLRGPFLFVLGTFNEVARNQVQALRETNANIAILAADTPGLREQVVDALGSSRSVLVHLPFADSPPKEGDRTRVGELARSLAPAIEHCGSLVLTGGDTARALLETLGIASAPIIGEVEPGIAVARLDDGRHVVLKAGGFGDNGVFVRLASP